MNRQAYRGGAVLVLTLLVLGTAAQARTWRVDDDGKADFSSLVVAIDAAETGDTIIVEPGTYSGGGRIGGRALTVRSRDPNDPAVVAGTVIDCRGSHAFTIGAVGVTKVTLAGLTVINSRNNADAGALHCLEAELNLLNCTFRNNTSTNSGGAIYCSDSRARFQGCTFAHNVSEAFRGGAIFCQGSVLELVGCSFEANTGRAVVNYDSQLILTDCTFRDNDGDEGAAIHSRKDVPGEIAVSLDLTRCTFTNNAATSCGGAVYSFRVPATFEACSFTSNTADKDGGALYHVSANTVLSNCAFFGNTAAGIGGAMSNWYGSSPRITNCTFVENRATNGGAIAGNGRSHAILSNCILWNNSAGQGPSLSLAPNAWDYGGVAVATVSHSNVAGGQNGVHVAADSVLHWSAGNIDVNPLFVSTRDRSLSGFSPCIDKGDPSFVPDSNAVDLAGNPRRSGVAVDMGAYEAGPAPVFRFWSPQTERHFYTINRGERDKLIRDYTSSWTYEGIAFAASTTQLDGMVGVHRFWSQRLSSHFWTIDEKEAQKLAREAPDLWTYEGIAFYAYLPYKQPWGSVPVYRFWWSERGGHFYTADEGEKDAILKNWPTTWTYEGIVWHVHSGPSR
jgi:predicted outer membrane repeat protein